MFDESRFTHEAFEYLEGSIDHRKIPAYGWNPAELDSVEDRLREALKAGRAAELIVELSQELASHRSQEAIRMLLGEILTAPNPRLKAIQIGLAFGSPQVITKTLAQWGSRFRMTKQGMQQAVATIRKRIGVHGGRNARTLQARENMSRAYHARHHSEPPLV